jgi:Na+-transporting NADH:ubiquinone oxidoreductase subunit F
VSDEVIIEVDGREVRCAKGTSLLNALINAGVLIGTACGGRGVCHFCRVTARGATTPVQPEESRALGNVLVANGMRLACRVVVDAPLVVSVPPVRGKGRR